MYPTICVGSSRLNSTRSIRRCLRATRGVSQLAVLQARVPTEVAQASGKPAMHSWYLPLT
jgi:hypothetical protein